MFKHVVFRIFAGLVLLAAIAGIAFFAYNAGVTQGALANVQAPAAQAEKAIPFYGYGMPFAPFHPFFGFGCFGILIPLFLFFLAFAAMRHMIWGPRMMGDHHERFARHLHNRWGEDGVPPFFAELHRRAHAQPPTADDAAKK